MTVKVILTVPATEQMFVKARVEYVGSTALPQAYEIIRPGETREYELHQNNFLKVLEPRTDKA